MHAKYEKSPRNTPLHLLTRGKQIKSLDCDTDPLNLSTERSYGVSKDAAYAWLYERESTHIHIYTHHLTCARRKYCKKSC